ETLAGLAPDATLDLSHGVVLSGALLTAAAGGAALDLGITIIERTFVPRLAAMVRDELFLADPNGSTYFRIVSTEYRTPPELAEVEGPAPVRVAVLRAFRDQRSCPRDESADPSVPTPVARFPRTVGGSRSVTRTIRAARAPVTRFPQAVGGSRGARRITRAAAFDARQRPRSSRGARPERARNRWPCLVRDS